MRSDASSVEEYLAEIPPESLAAIETLRSVVNANLGEGYEEGMQYGMIGWYVPHRVYPKGYHCDPKQPLPFASLASQKNHMALYLCGLNCLPGLKDAFLQGFAAAGKKLDMGAACVRFKRLDQLDMASVRAAVAAVPSAEFIASARASRKSR